MRILVVEDHEPFRRIICSLLRKRDFLVAESADGFEAIEKAKELQPDLILFDIGLPKLNGIESARQVRTQVPHSRLLFVSQESSSEVVRETLQLGALGYVHKPHALTDLFPAIDAVLSGKRFVSTDLEFGQGLDVLPWNQGLDQIAGTAEIENKAGGSLYEAILESLEEAIIGKDLNGTISYWNSAACRIFGYTKDEAIGQPITIIIPTDLRDEANDILRRVRAGERIKGKTRRVSKDGRILNMAISISPLRDSEGRIIGAAKITRRVS